MANIYVEPHPMGRPEGSLFTHYVLEFAHGARMDCTDYKTQTEVVAAAEKAGHEPLVARDRSTNKGNPDHWRAA